MDDLSFLTSANKKRK